MFLVATLSAAAGADVVHLKDGSQLSGKVTSCDEESCSIDKKRVERAAIVRITLAEGGTVPAISSGVVLTDGTVKRGPFIGMSLGFVELGDEEIDRADVAQIILAPPPPPPAPPPSQPPVYRPSPPPPPATAPPVQPPPQPSPPAVPPPTAPPPSYGSPGENLPRGRLWVGKLIARLWTANQFEQITRDVTVDARLREYTFSITTGPPSPKKAAEAVYLNEEGTVINSSYRSTSAHETCTGSAETTVNHPTGLWTSTIFRRTSSIPMPPPMFEIRANAPFYVLMIGPYYAPIPWIRITCVDPDRTRTLDLPFIVPMAGTLPTGTVSFDREIRYLDQGRMIGSYTGPGGFSGEQVSVSWAICLEGTACPPPAPLAGDDAAPTDTTETPPPDPCARAGQPQAFADTCRLQLDAKVAALDPLFAEYNELMNAAEANRAAFEAALKYCELYDRATEILELIITGGTGPAAEAAKGLLHLRNLIAKVQAGDLPSVLLPSEVKKVLDIYKQAKSIWFELTADEVSKMTRDLNACSGKAPIETYMNAKQFLEDLSASRQVWDTKVAPAINDVRAQGQECATKNHEAWRACFSEAECRGETPNCGPEPSLHGAYDEQ